MLDDQQTISLPKNLTIIRQQSAAAGFGGDLDARVGALLRVLAATRPGGFVLQLGSGRSETTAWLADGVAITTQLITLVSDPSLLAIAKRCFGDALNITVHNQDPLSFLQDVSANRFDLICCDALPDEFAVVGTALDLLAPGGLFVAVGGLNPDSAWPGDYSERVGRLLAFLRDSPMYQTAAIDSSTGVLLAVRLPVRTLAARRGGRRSRTSRR